MQRDADIQYPEDMALFQRTQSECPSCPLILDNVPTRCRVVKSIGAACQKNNQVIN